jgi:hypothetical protein
MIDGADTALKIDVINSSLRDKSYDEHNMGFTETDNL